MKEIDISSPQLPSINSVLTKDSGKENLTSTSNNNSNGKWPTGLQNIRKACQDA